MDIKFTIEAIFWVVIGLALIKLIRYSRKDKDKETESKSFRTSTPVTADESDKYYTNYVTQP